MTFDTPVCRAPSLSRTVRQLENARTFYTHLLHIVNNHKHPAASLKESIWTAHMKRNCAWLTTL